MASPISRITTPDIDLDAEGKQMGWARLPHSSNISAYGWIPIPITVIRNGDGPTVLVTAGNHGDEYEGQVAAAKLARSLEPEQIRGRVIIVTTLNAPAAQAGTRVSPIDGINLNRAFPGERDGTPTQIIAHWAEHVLLAMADYALDLHSGGRTLDYMPAVLAHAAGESRLDREALELMKVFGAPVGYLMDEPLDDRTLLGGALRQNVVGLGTELGGAGRVGREALAVGERGVRNVLGHLGVLVGAKVEGPPTGRMVGVGGPQHYAYAPDRGVFEYVVEPGEDVAAGQPIGTLHFVDDPAREPVTVRSQSAGLMLAKRHPGPCERGDCLMQLGVDLG